MLKRLTTWALGLTNPEPAVGRTEPTLMQQLIDAEEQIAHWKQRAETAERRANELLDACRGFEKQRDRWNRMYHQQAGEHTAAQIHLSGRIERLLVFIHSTLRMINTLRAQLNLEPMKMPTRFTEKDVFGESIKYAEEFVARQKATLEASKVLFSVNPMSTIPVSVTTADSTNT